MPMNRYLYPENGCPAAASLLADEIEKDQDMKSGYTTITENLISPISTGAEQPCMTFPTFPEDYTPVTKSNIDNKSNAAPRNIENKFTPVEGSTHDPKVWGPPFWYTLHVSAAYYPLSASPIVRERMKNRILAIPYEVPCESCRSHASAFIEKNRDNLDDIVSSRDKLGKFYVNFHNQVNKRYGKREWTYGEALRKYGPK